MSADYLEGLVRGYQLKARALVSKGENIQAKESAERALMYATKMNSSDEITESYNTLSIVLNSVGLLDSAITCSNNSLALDSTIKNRKKALLSLATTYRLKDDFARSMAYHVENLELSKTSSDTVLESKILANIGNLHASMGDFQLGLSYLIQSEHIFDSLNHLGFAQLQMSIGNLCCELKQFGDAERHYATSLRICRKMHFESLSMHILANIGNSYLDRNDNKNALKFLKQSTSLAKRLHDKSMLANLHLNCALAYMRMEDLDNAQEEAKGSMKLAEGLGSVRLKHRLFLTQYQVDSATGDFQSALMNFKKAQELRDSLFSKEKAFQVAEIREKFDAEKKAKTIIVLEREIERKKVQELNQRAYQNLVAVLLLSVFLTLGVLYWRLKTNRERDAATSMIEKQKEILNAQEEVQEKISRDLHDNIGQKLIALRMNIESSLDSGHELTNGTLNLLQEISFDVRNNSHLLSPILLQTEGLAFAFEKLVYSTFQRTGIDFAIELNNIVSGYPADIEINIYRICQELLANVVKHAGAKYATVQLSVVENNLLLLVEDNGKGMNFLDQKGFGLRNIENRARLFGGSIYCDSEPGRTTIIVRIPL